MKGGAAPSPPRSARGFPPKAARAVFVLAVIPGWSEGPDLRCAMHIGESRDAGFDADASPRNDGNNIEIHNDSLHYILVARARRPRAVRSGGLHPHQGAAGAGS